MLTQSAIIRYFCISVIFIVWVVADDATEDWVPAGLDGERLVPLTVPHRTSNDTFMDPCKSYGFSGDIALTKSDFKAQVQRVKPNIRAIKTILKTKFSRHLKSLPSKPNPHLIANIQFPTKDNQNHESQFDVLKRKCKKKRRKSNYDKTSRRRYKRCLFKIRNLYQQYKETIRNVAKQKRSKRAATGRPDRLWDYGVIPYEIEANFTGNHKALFKMAMRHWENYTCVTFIERRPEDQNYIVFTERPCGCCSFVGKRGNGAQAISIGKNCDKFGIVVHELGHVIGFWHEHTRPDRDEHVQIMYNNIMLGQEYNFNKLTAGEVNSLGEDYDYGSIMHYARNTFAKALFLDTILPRRKVGQPVRPEIGQRLRLSPGDIRQARKLYTCPKCGRTLQESAGSFSYNPQKEGHQRDAACRWRISATHGEKIVLNLTQLDIPHSPNCKLAYLEVRDGYYEQSSSLGKFCGSEKMPKTLESTDSRMWLEYKSTTGHGIGFLADYEAVCGGEILKQQGQLTSPNYPDDYKSDKECIWKITVQDRGDDGDKYQVALKFHSFEIENHDNCVYDYVEVRDGHEDDSPLLGRFCGYKIPEDIKSTGNKLYVKFKSDSSVQKAGFAATFVKEYDECATKIHGCYHICVNTLGSFKCDCKIGYELHSDGKKCEDACGGYIVASNGTIQSPSYPDLYPPNKNCVWQIVAQEQYRITLNFTHFDLEGNNQECDYDSVEVRSGTAKDSTLHGMFCGSSIPMAITSEDNLLRIEFNSDNSVRKTGFNAIFFTDKDECAIDNGGCQHICKNTLGSYKCSCHNGFTIHENKHDCKEGGCQYNIKSPNGKIGSPNWPDLYPSRKNCVWHFRCKPGHRIKLVFTSFELEPHQECNYDKIQIYDGDGIDARSLGRFCGSSAPSDIISSGNRMYMIFYSDASVQRKGFHAQHTTVCGSRLIAHTNSQDIFSHAKYGDQNYDNREDCNWTIEAKEDYNIRLRFLEFNIEDETDCGYDSVKVFDGKDSTSPQKGNFCGTKIPPEIVSSGKYITVHFKSDDTVNWKGFKAKYSLARSVTAKPGQTKELLISP